MDAFGAMVFRPPALVLKNVAAESFRVGHHCSIQSFVVVGKENRSVGLVTPVTSGVD